MAHQPGGAPEELKCGERANSVAVAATRARHLQEDADPGDKTWRRHLRVSGSTDYDGTYTRQGATFGFPCWARTDPIDPRAGVFQHLVYRIPDNKWCFLQTDFASFATCTDATKAFDLMKGYAACSQDGLLGTRQWDDASLGAAREISVSPLDHPDSCEKYADPTDLAEMNDFTKALEDAASGLRHLTPPFRHTLGNLLRESDNPPVTVTLGDCDKPAVWEFEVEGSWTKLDPEACVILEARLSEAVANNTTTVANYERDFGDGHAKYQVQLQGDQPTRCLPIAKQVNLNSQKTHKLRRIMFGNGATISVEKWYQAILMDEKLFGATAQTMADEQPQHVAFCLDALQHEKNFETAMAGLLARMHKKLGHPDLGISEEEHDLYFKDGDWESMITHVITRAKEIPLDKSIDPPGSTKLKGLGTLNALVNSMLSPGQEGVCISSLYEFFVKLIEPQKRVLTAKAMVDEAASTLRETVVKSELLDEIETKLHPVADCASFLRDGLPKFGIDIQAEAEGTTEMPNLEAAVKEFEEKLIQKHDEVDIDLLKHRTALMEKLTEVMIAVNERTAKMVDLQAVVETHAREYCTRTETFTQNLKKKQQQAKCTVTAARDKIKWVNKQVDEEMSRRKQERDEHADAAKELVKENQEKQEQVQRLIAEIKANEETLRGAAQTDRDAEKTHQHTIAAYEQNLGTLAGSLDEMQNFVGVIEVSIGIANQAREITSELLVNHENSIKMNIERDVKQTEALGRSLLTDHFVVFCQAFTKTEGDKQVLLNGTDVLEKEIKDNEAKTATAVKRKMQGRVTALREEREGLRKELSDQKTKAAELDIALESMYACVTPVIKALAEDTEPGRDFKLTAGRADDDELLAKIKTQVDDGPPKDPRGELEYKLLIDVAEDMQETHETEAQALEENLRAMKEAMERRLKQPVMLTNAPAPEPAFMVLNHTVNHAYLDQDGGALMRTHSQKRKAAIAAQASAGGNLEEGVPPKGGKKGGKKGWGGLFGGE